MPKTETIPTVAFPSDLTLSALGHEIDVADLPAQSLRYLLVYGFKQSLSDAGSLSKDQIAKWRKSDDWAKRAAELGVDTDADDKAIRDAYGTIRAAVRMTALRDGTVSESGPHLDPIEREAVDIAWNRAKDVLKAAGVKIPTDADAKAAIIEKYLAGIDGENCRIAARTVIAARGATSAVIVDLSSLRP